MKDYINTFGRTKAKRCKHKRIRPRFPRQEIENLLNIDSSFGVVGNRNATQKDLTCP